MDNSAQRLLSILEAAKAYPHKDQAAASVWKSVLNVEDDLRIPEKLGAVLVLSGKVARQVLEANPSSTKAVAHWRHRLYQACSYGLGQKWSDVEKQIDNHTIEYLRMHAQLLNYSMPTRILPKERFDEARSALERALEEIRQSDLRPDLKIALIDRIRAIVVAIENYAITGQDAVFDAFKLAVVDFKDEMARDGVPGRSNLREGLSIIADLMTVAASGVALAPPVQQLLEMFK